ncbi:hypothetical protein [Corallincola holothuriorum]|nr:hypothetical protein [Corallincola holothuriorum]
MVERNEGKEIVYSFGENGIDEHGEGDDLSLSNADAQKVYYCGEKNNRQD